MDYNYEEICHRVIEEEKELRFDDFTCSDAYEIGQLIVSKFDEIGIVCFEIHINGIQRVAYFPDKCTFNSSLVMARKRRVLNERNMSSLQMHCQLKIQGKTQEEGLLPPDKYCVFGGAFPIRLKSGTMIGSITTSGLFHLEDHEIITSSIREFLAKKSK